MAFIRTATKVIKATTKVIAANITKNNVNVSINGITTSYFIEIAALSYGLSRHDAPCFYSYCYYITYF